MEYRLGIDLGTTTLVAAAAPDGAPVELVKLGADRPAVAVATVRDPNLGGAEATAALLRLARDRASAQFGEPPVEIVLAEPGYWSEPERASFDQAVDQADLGPLRRVAQAEAAAAGYAAQVLLPAETRIAVFDLGGGSCEATVLQRTPSGFTILGSAAAPHPSGTDFDEAVYRFILGGLGERARDLTDPSQLASIRLACVAAKEDLSTRPQVEVQLPAFQTTVRLGRPELESLVRGPLRDGIALVTQALQAAGVAAQDLAAIVAVGGCCRMPIVKALLDKEFPVPIAVSTQPELEVAIGAAGGKEAMDRAAVAIVTPPPPAAPPPLPVAPPAAQSASPPPAAAGPPVVPPWEPPVPAPATVAAPVPPPGAAPVLAASAAVTVAPEPKLVAAPPSQAQPLAPEHVPPSRAHPQVQQGAPVQPGLPVQPGPGQQRPPVGAPGLPYAPPPGPYGGQGPGGFGPPPAGSNDGAARRKRLLLIIAGAVVLGGALTGVALAMFGRPPITSTSTTLPPASTVLPNSTAPPASTAPPNSTAPPGSTPASPAPTTPSSTSPPAGRWKPSLPKAAPLPKSLVVVPMRRGGATGEALYLVDSESRLARVKLPAPAGSNSNPMMQLKRDTIIYIHDGVMRVMASDGSGDRKLFKGAPGSCDYVLHASWNLADPNVMLISCRLTTSEMSLLVINQEGKLIRRLGTGKKVIGDFSVSPDGRTVVYWASNDPKARGGSLFTIPLAGTGAPKQVTKATSGVDAYPAWSPDGSRIAFSRRFADGSPQGNLDVFVMKADGSGTRAVATTPAVDFKAVWSPDGRNLLIISNRQSDSGKPGRYYDLWLTRASDGKVLKQLGLKAERITHPFWALR